ncbi:MAG: hypothetical protein IPP15_14800 [Saprospiraceae bacterium]|uniref:Helix-turn-helix type 11 domain-containing protein n=1 Tax=Candidatus Opimibacter skivensis TaxID=2982028 RepID=A0A9D7SUQ4_9BACT|nr:hypothetical protein [Candidatus Opimibacter skivensis]
MSILQNVRLLKKMHGYLNRKSTGTPENFAHRLGISESTLYRIFQELNDEGITTKFDSLLASYYYEGDLDILSLFK